MAFDPSPSECPLCGTQNKFTFLQDFSREERTFSLYECNVCAFQFWQPFQSPGATWYETRGNNKIQEILKPTITREYHKRILDLAQKDWKGKKILDVGCGTGEFLAELQKKGCEVWGIDFDPIAIRVGRKHFLLKNLYAMPINKFFEATPLPIFDCITCFEVIEHVDNPKQLLLNLVAHIKPAGKIFLSTPSRERMGAHLNGWDYPPNHLSRWNEKAIMNVCKLSGLKVLSITYIEQFRILLESMNAKFHTGLVRRGANSSQGSPSLNSRRIKTRILYVLGTIKVYILGGIPAFCLWIYGMRRGKKNGGMFIELALE